MGELGEFWRDVKSANQERKYLNQSKNLAVLEKSGLDYVIRQDGSILNFGKGVQFYPSTNKWTVGTKVIYGDAQCFINWYKKHHGGTSHGRSL